ncbi:hypothetical protein ACE193_20660 [Bernardetia sp. OM2101]|uniref:hypothetical protein n=1 Tax=Bernardetia sp. OM2101 TaxID=3344876 RepID=UPI0035D0CB76
MFERAAKKNSRNTNYQLWQQNNHAEELFSDKFLHQKLDYIHNNPVVEGIVEEADQYFFYKESISFFYFCNFISTFKSLGLK